MSYMHAQGGMPIPAYHHINQPGLVRSEGGDLYTRGIRTLRVRKSLKPKSLETRGPTGSPPLSASLFKVPAGVHYSAKHITGLEIQRICDKYNVLGFIADEVICGFLAATGTAFGSQTMGSKRIFMTIARALSLAYQADWRGPFVLWTEIAANHRIG